MEIELYSKLNDPGPLLAIEKMGSWMAESSMFGVTKPAQGMVLALIAVTEKLTPMQVKRKYHITPGGHIIEKAHHVLAEFLRIGGKHKWLKDGEDGQAARIRLELQGRDPIEYEYTVEMAKRAGLVRADSGWQKDPGKQLRARCETGSIAMIAPEVLTGLEDEIVLPQVAVTPLFPDKPKPPPPIVDAEVISAESREVQTGEGAEAPNPAYSPRQVEIIDGKPSPESIKTFLSMAQARGLEFEKKAGEWLTARQWMENGNLFSITPARLQQIFDKWDEWCGVVERAE